MSEASFWKKKLEVVKDWTKVETLGGESCNILGGTSRQKLNFWNFKCVSKAIGENLKEKVYIFGEKSLVSFTAQPTGLLFFLPSHLPMIAVEPNWSDTTIAILPCTNASMLNQIGSNMTIAMVSSTNGRSEPNLSDTTIANLPCTNCHMLNHVGSNMTIAVVPSTNGRMRTKLFRYDHCNSPMYQWWYVEPNWLKYDHPIVPSTNGRMWTNLVPYDHCNSPMYQCSYVEPNWFKCDHNNGPIYQWSHENQIGQIRPLQFSHVPMVVCWTMLVQIWPLQWSHLQMVVCELNWSDTTIAILPYTNGRMFNQIGLHITIAMVPTTNYHMWTKLVLYDHCNSPMYQCLYVEPNWFKYDHCSGLIYQWSHVNQNGPIRPFKFSHAPIVVCWSHLPMVACEPNSFDTTIAIHQCTNGRMLNQIGSDMTIAIAPSTNGCMWTKLVRYTHCNSPMYQWSYVEPNWLKYDNSSGPIYHWLHVNQSVQIWPFQ